MLLKYPNMLQHDLHVGNISNASDLTYAEQF